MAHAMLSGTSRVHMAGLFYRSPSTWLSAPSSSPLLWGPQCLLSAHSISATSSHSSACQVEQKWWTHGRKGWKINAKTTQLLGKQPWVKAQSPLWDAEDSIFYPSVELQSEDLHKHGLPNLHLDQRPSVKVASDKGQVTRQDQANS